MNKYSACCLMLLMKNSFLNTMDREFSQKNYMPQKQKEEQKSTSCCPSALLCCPIVCYISIGYGVEKVIQANHRLGIWLGYWSNEKLSTPLSPIAKEVDKFLNSKIKSN